MITHSVRRGFTLIELMIGMIILGIVGATLTKMLVSQSRFMDRQTAQRSARSTSRVAQNIMLSELRMVEVGGGIVAAAPTAITVRVPVAFGLYCGGTTVSLLPADQHMYNSASISGYAWRSTAGAYTYQETIVVGVGAEPTCAAQQIATLAGGRVITVGPALPGGTPMGSPVMLYQTVRYDFRGSLALPGKIALWRTLMTNGVTEEIAAPFDPTAGFGFYVGANTVPSITAPPQLNTIRGIQLMLHGNSERPPSGTLTALTERLTTSVFFKNRLD